MPGWFCLLYLSISSFERLHYQFEFRKRRQLFIRVHNKMLSVVPMCVNNPECSPVRINRCDVAPTRKTQNVSTSSTRFE